MKKRLLSLTLSLALIIGLFAGCGGNKDPQGSKVPESPAASDNDQPETPNVLLEPEESVNLEFWYAVSGPAGDAIESLVEQFNNSQDKVHVEALYQGTYTDAGTKLQAAVAGGTPPQIAQIEITSVGMYASLDKLFDMTPYANTDPDFNINDLYEGVLDFSYYDGKLISLPNGRSIPLMYYNKDVLKEAPTTWEELRAASAATVDGDRKGFGFPVTDSWYWLNLVLSAGGQVYNDAGNDIGFYENGAGVKALQSLVDMQNDGSLFLPTGDGYASNIMQAFMNQLCTITFASCSRITTFADYCSFDVGVALVPKDAEYASIPGGSNLVALAGDYTESEKAAIWQFMKYMVSGEAAGAYAAATGYLPTSDAALNSTVYQEAVAKYPNLPVAVEQLKYSKAIPTDEGYTEVKDQIIGRYVQECLIGGMTPEDAVENMHQEVMKFYK